MSLADKLEKNEKINLVLGDYFLKNTGMPSRIVLSNLFYMNFPVERREQIANRNSFFNVSQGFLDFGIGNRGTLVNSIVQHYSGDSDRVSKFKKFIFSNRVESIISLDYDTMLEKYCGDYISKISFQGLERDEEKISYYKCFGDVQNPNELIISGQDFRKFIVLPHYKNYIMRLKKEFTERKTVFFGCDLENSDLLEFFTFMLKDLEREKLKPIYFITGEKEHSEKVLEFLKRFDIQMLGDELHTFREKSIDFKVEELEKIEKTEKLEAKPEVIEQLEIFQEVEKETVEKIVEEIEETEEVDEVLEENGILTLRTGFRLETAPELQFNSLHLYKNPIKFNNIPELLDEKILFKNDNPVIKLGDEQIFGTKLKVTSSNLGKFLELKNREFRIKLSVVVDKNRNLYLDKDYLEYEIYSSATAQRMNSIIELFISLFSGMIISLITSEVRGELNLHNRLQMLKFQIMRESHINYNFVSEKLPLNEEKKFSLSSLTYYQNYLLWSYLNGNAIETWGNLEMDSPIDFGKYSGVILEREHSIRFKGGEERVIERITIPDVSESGEVNRLMKKRVRIELEIKAEDV